MIIWFFIVCFYIGCYFLSGWQSAIAALIASLIWGTMAGIVKQGYDRQVLLVEAYKTAVERHDKRIESQKQTIAALREALLRCENEKINEPNTYEQYRMEVQNFRFYSAQLQTSLNIANGFLNLNNLDTVPIPPTIPTVLKSEVDGERVIK